MLENLTKIYSQLLLIREPFKKNFEITLQRHLKQLYLYNYRRYFQIFEWMDIVVKPTSPDLRMWVW